MVQDSGLATAAVQSRGSVLVCGGAGYIGSHTCKRLAAAGWQPVVLDNFSTGHPWAVRWGTLLQGDLLDRSFLRRVFRLHQFTAVMHFADHALVGESMAKPAKYLGENAAKIINLLEESQQAGVDQLIFSSTCAVYGVPAQVPITEDTPLTPVNPYGESKRYEEQCLRWFGTCHGTRSVALRYFNAAGADPEGELGEDHLNETHLLPLALDATLGRHELAVAGTDYATADGTAIRDYIHVMDLADAHVRALEYLHHGGASTACNLGTGRGTSVAEMIQTVERVTGRRVAWHAAPRRAGDPPILVAEPQRARELLGWSPQHSSLDEIVSTAWNWHSRLRQALRAHA